MHNKRNWYRVTVWEDGRAERGRSLCLFSLNDMPLTLGGWLSNFALISTFGNKVVPSPPRLQSTFPAHISSKENSIAYFYELVPVPNHFGLGRSLLGASLLSSLCILEVDGAADKNRNRQRS